VATAALNTFSQKNLDGTGILGQKVGFVTSRRQIRRCPALLRSRSKDGCIMINGGSSSGVAVAVQGPVPRRWRDLYGGSL
jgi:hypothetical protein